MIGLCIAGLIVGYVCSVIAAYAILRVTILTEEDKGEAVVISFFGPMIVVGTIFILCCWPLRGPAAWLVDKLP